MTVVQSLCSLGSMVAMVLRDFVTIPGVNSWAVKSTRVEGQSRAIDVGTSYVLWHAQ